jgi:hypothetical protein
MVAEALARAKPWTDVQEAPVNSSTEIFAWTAPQRNASPADSSETGDIVAKMLVGGVVCDELWHNHDDLRSDAQSIAARTDGSSRDSVAMTEQAPFNQVVQTKEQSADSLRFITSIDRAGKESALAGNHPAMEKQKFSPEAADTRVPADNVEVASSTDQAAPKPLSAERSAVDYALTEAAVEFKSAAEVSIASNTVAENVSATCEISAPPAGVYTCHNDVAAAQPPPSGSGTGGYMSTEMMPRTAFDENPLQELDNAPNAEVAAVAENVASEGANMEAAMWAGCAGLRVDSRADYADRATAGSSQSSHSIQAMVMLGNIIDDATWHMVTANVHDAHSADGLSTVASGMDDVTQTSLIEDRVAPADIAPHPDRLLLSEAATQTAPIQEVEATNEATECPASGVWEEPVVKCEKRRNTHDRIELEAQRVSASTRIQARFRGSLARATTAEHRLGHVSWRADVQKEEMTPHARYDAKIKELDIHMDDLEELMDTPSTLEAVSPWKARGLDIRMDDLGETSTSLDTAPGDALAEFSTSREDALGEFSISREVEEEDELEEEEEDGEGSLAWMLQSKQTSADPPPNSLMAILRERLVDKPPPTKSNRTSRFSTGGIFSGRRGSRIMPQTKTGDVSRLSPEAEEGVCRPKKGLSAFAAIRSGDLTRIRTLVLSGKLCPAHIDSCAVVDEHGRTLLQAARDSAHAQILRMCFHMLQDKDQLDAAARQKALDLIDPEVLGNIVPIESSDEDLRMEYSTMPSVLARGKLCNYPCEILQDGVRQRLDDAFIRSQLFGRSDSEVHFSVKPKLPQGLVLDETTGGIRGTPREVMEADCYRVIASITLPSSPDGIATVPSSMHIQVTFGVAEAPAGLSYPYLERVVEDGVPNAGLDGDWFEQCEAIAELNAKTLPTRKAATPRVLPPLARAALPGRADPPLMIQYLDALPTLEEGVSEIFEIEPPLPEGMTLDPITGLIDGSPLNVPTGLTSTHVVSAKNAVGVATCVLQLVVERGEFGLLWFKLYSQASSSLDENEHTTAIIRQPSKPVAKPAGKGRPPGRSWDYWRVAMQIKGGVDWGRIVTKCAAMLSLYGTSMLLRGPVDGEFTRASQGLSTSALVQMLSLGHAGSSHQEFLKVVSYSNHALPRQSRMAVCYHAFEVDGTRIREPVVYLEDGTSEVQMPQHFSGLGHNLALPAVAMKQSTVQRIQDSIRHWEVPVECGTRASKARKTLLKATPSE